MVRSELITTLKTYSSSDFKLDLFAGLTVGSVLVPQSLAYATLVGLEPIYGLYASIVPLIIYALLGNSKRLAIGPVAVSAILVLAGVSAVVPVDDPQYYTAVILVGFLVGLGQLILGVFKLGFISDFLSKPVLSGFISGASLIIVATQIPAMLGIDVVRQESFLANLKAIANSFEQLNQLSLTFFTSSFIIIILLGKFNRKIPSALVVLILSLAAVYIGNLDQMGLDIVGVVPSGLPNFELPGFELDLIKKLLPVSAVVLFIGFVESFSIAKVLEYKHNEDLTDPDRELIALGTAKLVGSFFQAFPTSASFSRSAINSNMNAKSQASTLVAVLMVLAVLLFLTPVFYFLPKAVLAAIIVGSVLKLFDWRAFKKLWKSQRIEFYIMLATFLATLGFNISTGILLGVTLSFVLFIQKNIRPNISILENIEGTNFFKNTNRFKTINPIDKSIIVRLESPLFFGNCKYFADSIYSIVAANPDLQYLILDASQIYYSDATGTFSLKKMEEKLNNAGITMYLCGATGNLRDNLFMSGLLTEHEKHHVSIDHCVRFLKGELDTRALPVHAMQSNKKDEEE